jgi:short-subunit dehydrogenase
MNFDNIKNKKALITGSTDGLGKDLAIKLAKKGADIVIHGRNEEKAKLVLDEIKELNKSGKHSMIICDFNEPYKISKSFEEITELDILINNAGIWAEGNTTDTTGERIIQLINVNLTATLLVTRQLLPVLQKSDFSQILNVSSIAGVEIPQEYFHTIYSSAKFGVQAFSEALAKEFSNKDLRIMGFYPGGMDTEFFKKAGLDYKSSEPWMFKKEESVDSIVFMLTRNKKVNVKRLDIVNQLEI